jgi:hypothetical protein
MNTATEPQVSQQDVVARLEAIQKRTMDILRRRQAIDAELANARAEENALFDHVGGVSLTPRSAPVAAVPTSIPVPTAIPITEAPKNGRRGRKKGAKAAAPTQVRPGKPGKASAKAAGKKKASKSGRIYGNEKPLKLNIWDLVNEATPGGGLSVDEIADKLIKGKLFETSSKNPKQMISSHTYAMHGKEQLARHEDTKKYYVAAGTPRPAGREKATTAQA